MEIKLLFILSFLFSIRNTFVRDPTTIQFLFEVSRSLHDCIDLSNIKDKENNRSAHLISRFIHMVMTYCLHITSFFLIVGQEMPSTAHQFCTCSNKFPGHNIQVDYGYEGERHLTFLVQCRGAFGSMSEVKVNVFHNLQRCLNGLL